MKRTIALAAGLSMCWAAQALAAGELNIYSSRHYDTDERLYSNFEEKYGVKINRIEDGASKLIARIEAEGDNSPADLLITVDAGRLWLATEKGMFQPISSGALEETIPAHLRHPMGHWFGFSQRARVIFYDKDRVNPEDIQTYEALADPKLEGMVCTRTSGNIYMLSLMSALIAHKGADDAKTWAEGVWNNRARDPEGGDTDQIRGIASGQCAIAVANTYYFARALRKDVRGLDNPDDTSRIGVVFPNQDSFGTHVNISGAGVLKNAPNKDNAVLFLEYLTTPEAQAYFSEGNDEYPVVGGVDKAESLKTLGEFKADTLDLTALGENQAQARLLYDEVGFQ